VALKDDKCRPNFVDLKALNIGMKAEPAVWYCKSYNDEDIRYREATHPTWILVRSISQSTTYMKEE
jgi:hypothetical protein